MQASRQLFNLDDDSVKLIMNCILETELQAYVVDLADHKVTGYDSLTTTSTVIDLDKLVANNIANIEKNELRIIASTHFNPIWRVSAYFCDFILRSHELYK